MIALKNYTRISDSDIEAIKVMALKSITPYDIAKQFGIGISTVHLIKRKIRMEQGIEFPKLIGKRPAGYTEENISDSSSHNLSQILDSNRKKDHVFIINGASVTISSAAKKIVVREDSIEVEF